MAGNRASAGAGAIGALCLGVLQFFESPDVVFREVRRILRDRGMFAFTTVDRRPGEEASFTADGEAAEHDRTVPKFRHATSEIRILLEAAGFVPHAPLEFTAYMDTDRTARLSMVAHLAQGTPRV